MLKTQRFGYRNRKANLANLSIVISTKFES